MEKRKTDCERSEEYARRQLVKHVVTCLVCSDDDQAARCGGCAKFLTLTKKWGHSLQELEQERRAIAGCS